MGIEHDIAWKSSWKRLIYINCYVRVVTLCTRHAHIKYIIDNRMFTIHFKNGRWSENISLKKLLDREFIQLSKFVFNPYGISWTLWSQYMYTIIVNNTCIIKKSVLVLLFFPPKKLYDYDFFFCSVMEFLKWNCVFI